MQVIRHQTPQLRKGEEFKKSAYYSHQESYFLKAGILVSNDH
jgi:hypothetical protein